MIKEGNSQSDGSIRLDNDFGGETPNRPRTSPKQT